MEMNGSRTEKNLLKAFAGESQARNRYTFAADVAEAEGYMQIAEYFRETADEERAHAFLFFSLLDGGMPEIAASYPAGPVGGTAANLLAAAEGEKMEWGTLYPDFAQVAEDEGFKKVAAAFRKVSVAENYHERRYRKLLANVEAGTVFKKDAPVLWDCAYCGYVHEGPEAPKVCPVCGKPQAYFELLSEPY